MTVDQLATDLLEASLSHEPLSASIAGISGYDDRLPDLRAGSEPETAGVLAAIARRAEAEAGAQGAEQLTESELQTLDFVRYRAASMADAAEVPLVEWTVGDFHAAPVTEVLLLLPEVPLDSKERAGAYLDRLAKLDDLLSVAAGRHLDGAASGRAAVGRLVRAAIAQLDAIIADPDLGGIRREPQHFEPGYLERRDQLLDHAVKPALSNYRDALESTILPVARPDDRVGLCFLPGGDDFYEALCRLHTSSDHPASELHATGLRIIEELAAEFAPIGDRLFGTSTTTEIFDHLRSDPKLRFETSEEMLESARSTVRRAEQEAPKWFGQLPSEACAVEPVPPAQQAGSPAAYYLPGALDGSRHGTYFVNASRPSERFRHAAEAVAFHEAVPGHHLQIAIAQQQKGLPLVRRLLGDTACIEGWGLYSERLADEMGLYSGDVARAGMLSADAWRAGRLVVDTGIHALGWSRERAVEWMAANTPIAPLEIEIEIDRYITYPGQALSYMVGRLEIVRLRRHAKRVLQQAFDLRTFHDHLLELGGLPLRALATAVDRWIVRQSPAST